jgi:hypothetical protein
MSTSQRHQPLEYYTSRQTPPRRTPKRPLKLEVRYCVGAVDNAEIIDTVHARRAPMIPVTGSLRL